MKFELKINQVLINKNNKEIHIWFEPNMNFRAINPNQRFRSSLSTKRIIKKWAQLRALNH